MLKMNLQPETRSIARQLARELRPEELDSIGAGTDSCSGTPAVPDD
jgi:hypothetical protein